MNIKTLCHPEYKRISVESLLNPVEETIDCEKPHSQTKINTAKPISASLYVTTNNTAVVRHNVQKRKGVTRRCPQCAVIKTSPQWREGPDGEVTLCNACGLFYRKIFLVFGKDLAKRYFNEIKGVSVKRKVPKSLYGVTRTR
ncbi:Gat3p [Saccharomyces cerevisiae YJM326]|nr:Gat3p [Saccharomyces cerevisiae YJM1133]AJV51935.1 Gat3p [Saccharomyces cerevisiae YJM1304]AJV53273.1 Gat3p [Saccharomyces cerevisiae YJM1326]AJV65348.1 Gat3p [Saccharomyces cerevisiae YJM1444]AJV75521.1 Gat3p [Saccharomyces cerevisiae YJM326]AJV80906.1 Gat3p [Saccharomyces cerevisiae YJM682]AJV81359.1 Gat3p [Saccharomyces cerevisiae YJM683]CAI4628649.1 ABA_G0035720.mRNA.1.CDS.1 [Saccharomyces cerevisiae]